MCKRCLLITRKKSTSILKHFSQKIMFKRRGYKEVKCEENKQEFEKKPCYKNQVFLLYCDQDADFVEKSLLTCICMIVNEKRWGHHCTGTGLWATSVLQRLSAGAGLEARGPGPGPAQRLHQGERAGAGHHHGQLHRRPLVRPPVHTRHEGAALTPGLRTNWWVFSYSCNLILCRSQSQLQ